MNRALTASPPGDRPLVVVDLGGTWVRVSVSGPAPRAYRGPTPGVAGLPALLARLWRRWRLSRGGLAALGVASRGIWTRGERQALARRLRRFAPRVVVISDVEAAYLAALGAVPGVLLLAGTGSIALGRDRRGRFVRAGGLGPLLGDDGSAFAIGRAWLRDAVRPGARAPDRDGAPTRSRAWPRSRPAFSAARGAATGPPARVVREAQQALAALAAGTARALRLRPPVTLSWAGGLLGNAPFRAGVWRRPPRPGPPHPAGAPEGARREPGAPGARSVASGQLTARLAGARQSR